MGGWDGSIGGKEGRMRINRTTMMTACMIDVKKSKGEVEEQHAKNVSST